MTINIQSTTDTPEQVSEANGVTARAVDAKATTEPVETSEDGENSTAEADQAAGDKSAEVDTENKATKTDKTDEDAEGDEPEAEPETDKQPRKKGGYQRKIERLERQIEMLTQAQLAARQPIQADTQPAKTDATGKPVIDNFQTYEEYEEALLDWKVEQKLKDVDAKRVAETTKAQEKSAEQEHFSRVNAVREKYDDFDDVLSDVADIQPSKAVTEFIMTSDAGGELLYALAKNPGELNRINSLPPAKAAVELARFEIKLSASQVKKSSKGEAEEVAKQPTAKAVISSTKAPPPIEAGSARGSASVTFDPDKASFKDFEQWRKASSKR